MDGRRRWTLEQNNKPREDKKQQNEPRKITETEEQSDPIEWEQGRGKCPAKQYTPEQKISLNNANEADNSSSNQQEKQ